MPIEGTLSVGSGAGIWAAATLANGGTISAARRNLVTLTHSQLGAKGLVSKLDRLWLFAAENQPSALTDIIAGVKATNVASTTFTVDRGYTGNGSTMYIDTNFNPTSVVGMKFSQDDATIFAWCNTVGVQTTGLFGWKNGESIIFPGSDSVSVSVNSTTNVTSALAGSDSNGIGLFATSRPDSDSVSIRVNGAPYGTASGVPSAVTDHKFFALQTDLGFNSKQISGCGIGKALSIQEHADLYTILRAYMTAVGVP